MAGRLQKQQLQRLMLRAGRYAPSTASLCCPVAARWVSKSPSVCIQTRGKSTLAWPPMQGDHLEGRE